MAVTQENRLIAVETPLGRDALIFRSMRVSEALGRMFEINLELLSSDFDIAFDKMLGQSVTVRIEPEPGRGDARYFNGLVSEFSQTGALGEHATYRATLRPWLWFLTRSADCRIYQAKTVPDIIDEIFKDHGMSDYTTPSGTFRKWDYCVQYRETAFNFVSRLMEQEGIYYYFEHTNGKHTMKLCTPESSKAAYPRYDEIRYSHEGSQDEQGRIHSWELTRNVQPTSYALDDYNYETPGTSLAANEAVSRGHSLAEFGIYDYPGEYSTAADGKNYAKLRIEELQAEFERVYGTADARGLACGYVFTLTGEVRRKDQEREYLVVSATHVATSADVESGSGGGTVEYSCSFQAMDSKSPFRTPRTTPKPVVQGPQTALVVGPSGEEIHTDKYGRVKIKFHWDRYGKADDNSSCWVRVGQSIAGNTWGAFTLPRIGQEVIVEFLEGDPDRPLVTGSVYNDANKPPFELPQEKNRFGIRSNSTKQGSGGFNELTFDDTTDKEQIVLHAQNDMHVKVLNDRHDEILNDLHRIVENDKFENVKRNYNLDVGGDKLDNVGGKLSLKVTGDVAEEFGGDHSETTTGDVFIKGANIVLEAGTNITLKVGGSWIAIEAGGITINTSGTLEGKGTSVEITASATAKVDGGGMTEIKGGMVKIN